MVASFSPLNLLVNAGQTEETLCTMSIFWTPGKAPIRSNTIRGTIGPPIPKVYDDEFPIRTPGTGIATPIGEKSQEQALGVRASTATDQSTLHGGIASNDSTNPAEAAFIPAQLIEEPVPRTTQPDALRNSMTSGPSGSSIEKRRRGKRSLRSVLGRLFGKKRRNDSTSGQTDLGPATLRRNQHRSDTAALNRPSLVDIPQKRSASVPITEYNRALRSRSTVMEDFSRYGERESNLASIQADGHTRPRRATTPSRLWTPNKGPGYVDWTGLSPRPASSHVKESGLINEPEADSSIGIALTSGNHQNRRSRSLGGMREVAPLPTIARRRSDEIRYWRESYDPDVLSPMSSFKVETEEPIILSDDPEHHENKENIQPFSFGTMSEMAGMKITQAASLDTRVQQLEMRMQNLEPTVFRLAHGVPFDTLYSHGPPKRNASRLRSTSVTRPATGNSDMSLPRNEEQRHMYEPGQESQQDPTQSSSFSRPSTTDTNESSERPTDTSLPTLPSPKSARISSQDTTRPLSTSTNTRGVSSDPDTMPKDVFLTAKHYTDLANMIMAEQTARQHLEDVVHKLQKQLLSTLGSLPLPQSNGLKNSSSDEAPVGAVSSFEQDSDDEEHYDTDAFKTPNEEHESFVDDTFGNVMHDGGKRAPRTLSLSQITMKKGAQHA